MAASVPDAGAYLRGDDTDGFGAVDAVSRIWRHSFSRRSNWAWGICWVVMGDPFIDFGNDRQRGWSWKVPPMTVRWWVKNPDRQSALVVVGLGLFWRGRRACAHLLPLVLEPVEDMLRYRRTGRVGLYLALGVHSILLDEWALSYFCVQFPHPKGKVNQGIKQFKRFKLVKSI